MASCYLMTCSGCDLRSLSNLLIGAQLLASSALSSADTAGSSAWPLAEEDLATSGRSYDLEDPSKSYHFHR
jgi:hypothetical protein